MKGFVTIETDDNVYWFYYGTYTESRPDCDEDDYYYEADPDKAEAILSASKEPGFSLDVVGIILDTH
jgi:hypothetical protein